MNLAEVKAVQDRCRALGYDHRTTQGVKGCGIWITKGDAQAEFFSSYHAAMEYVPGDLAPGPNPHVHMRVVQDETQPGIPETFYIMVNGPSGNGSLLPDFVTLDHEEAEAEADAQAHNYPENCTISIISNRLDVVYGPVKGMLPSTKLWQCDAQLPVALDAAIYELRLLDQQTSGVKEAIELLNRCAESLTEGQPEKP